MIAVLFAPEFSAINYYLDSGLSLSLIGCITIYIVYKIDNFINKMIIKSSKSIFIINFLISFFISSIFFAFISWFLNIILRDEWSLNFSFLRQQMLIVNFLLILILSYHTILYFTRSITLKNRKLTADNLEMSLALKKYLTRIPSLSNKKTVLIPIKNVLFFKIEEGIVFAYTSENNKKALTTTTLNSLEPKLNPVIFFRINRSEIVNLDKVESYEPYLKDRLAIKISKSNITLYTSNSKSSSFRERLVK